MECCCVDFEKGVDDDKIGVFVNVDIFIIVMYSFVKIVEGILIGWYFLELGDVYFDFKICDFVIVGKLCSVFGKGFCVIIYVVFIFGLLVFC